MKNKKSPMRKCVGCGKSFPKTELIRIVKNKELGIMIDNSNKLNGRGVYICKSIDCLNNARKNNEIKRNLRTNIDEELYDELEKIIE